MPLINGQKMACAPCIRGHRSTKCNHAAERVMVPVRKPGRPLSSCPCPPGRPCACGGIKVAIPRKQKCSCGPSMPNGTHDETKTESSSSPQSCEPPASPTRGPFRVKKSGSVSRQTSRKQSFDPVNLERVDPNSINIVNQFGNFDPKTMPTQSEVMAPPQNHATVVSGIGFVQSLPPTEFHQPDAVNYGAPLGHTAVPPQQPGPSSTSSTTVEAEGHSKQHANGSGSCCSGHSAPPKPAPADMVVPPATNGSAVKSCCGSSKAEVPVEEPESEAPAIAAQQTPTTTDGGFVVPFQTSVDLKHQPYMVPFQQPTTYTYPADYGSWTHPINQETWLQLQSFQPDGASYSNPAVPITPNGSSTASALGTSHQCVCGPGCQCVGCLAHPFNNRTLQYVTGAWEYQVGVSPTETYSKDRSLGPDGNVNADANLAQGQAKTTEAPGSPPRAQTPSDASALSEEQSLSTSEFLFFNVPLYLGDNTEGGADCGGAEAYCPCGDDCQCDGCTVHNARPFDYFAG